MVSRLDLSEFAWLDLRFLASRRFLYLAHNFLGSNRPAMAEIARDAMRWCVLLKQVQFREGEKELLARLPVSVCCVNEVEWLQSD